MGTHPRHTLTFEENPRGEDPVAYLRDGTPVFPDRKAKKAIRPGDTWICAVERKGSVGFALPLKPDEVRASDLRGNEKWIEALLGSDAGQELKRALNRAMETRWNEIIQDELDGFRARLSALEDRTEARLDALATAEETDDSTGSTLDAKRPRLEDGEEPTAEFIERKILWQLFRMRAIGGKHTSGEHFKQGELRGVDTSRIEAVVRDLAARGILLPHSKQPDEHYSLNPKRLAYVYDALDVATDGDGAGGDGADDSATGNDGSAADAADRSDVEAVPRGKFENTVRKLREEIRSLGAESRNADVADLSQKVAALKRRLTDVDGRTSGNDGEINRLKRDVADLDRRMAALERAPGSGTSPGRVDPLAPPDNEEE